jgi:hypothetical protein
MARPYRFTPSTVNSLVKFHFCIRSTSVASGSFKQVGRTPTCRRFKCIIGQQPCANSPQRNRPHMRGLLERKKGRNTDEFIDLKNEVIHSKTDYAAKYCDGFKRHLSDETG